MNTTYSRHLAFPAVAEAYNYDHEILIDDLTTEQLVLFFQLDENDAYIARSYGSRFGDEHDEWMVVSVESSNDMAHVNSRVTYQRDRLSSGLYPSFVSRESYAVTLDDDGTRIEQISLV